MLARVTNGAKGPRGFETRDRGIVLIEPGDVARLDLADNAAHRAWVAAGEVSIEPIETPSAEAEARPAPRRQPRGERRGG